MLVKILGSIDVITGIVLFFLTKLNLPAQILIFLAFVLFIKSTFGMLRDFASWIDFLAGSIFLLSIAIQIPSAISIIFSILILQKGIFSFL